MKKAFCFLFLFFSLALFSNAQELNKTVVDTTLDREVIIGYCNRFGLSWGEFQPYLAEEYEAYKPHPRCIRKSKKKNENIEVLIVLGTWCHDSQTQVPRFLKYFDEAGFKEDQLTMIGVDRSKTAGDVDISSLNIERVPTFIFYRDNKELGRIIETPKKSLERDSYKIIRKKH